EYYERMDGYKGWISVSASTNRWQKVDALSLIHPTTMLAAVAHNGVAASLLPHGADKTVVNGGSNAAQRLL
ncbi:MAG: hypothetical protein HQL48_11940, partial [Gammaproteobacteria bacterium]|nr:hypothetical protein [Gammaproteobacteria bacterium]